MNGGEREAIKGNKKEGERGEGGGMYRKSEQTHLKES